MKTIIHVNQHLIRANKRDGTHQPVLSVKTYKETSYGHSARILDKDGKEVARIVYRPDKPLSCGARVWIETNEEVRVKFESKP